MVKGKNGEILTGHQFKRWSKQSDNKHECTPHKDKNLVECLVEMNKWVITHK